MPDQLRITILGCGSSGGVPRIGNDWGSCDPENPRNARRRCSLLVERTSDGGPPTRVLVDAGPDLRAQCLDANVDRLDGVVITHEHADHVHGLDELRALYLRNRRNRIPLWTDRRTSEVLRARFGYAFERPAGSGYPPFLELRSITGLDEIPGPAGPVPLRSFSVPHGDIEALGLRFGPLGYTPDLSAMSEDAWAALAGVDTWIVDALQIEPHPSHTHLEQTLQWIERLAPRRAVLTNMHFHLDHDAVDRATPEFVSPAHDGMVISLPVQLKRKQA